MPDADRGPAPAPARDDALLERLLEIRDREGGVADRDLVALAATLGRSPAELYEVARFYPALGYAPDGAARAIEICDDLVCALQRTPALAAALEAGRLDGGQLDGRPCRRGACRGLCDRAPVVHDPAAPVAAPDDGTADLDAYRARGGYAALLALRGGGLSGDAILAALAQHGAVGRAGVGFPLARKWRAVRDAGRPPVVIVNGDEGELATFKDRAILADDPHAVLDAALVAATVVGAARVVVYLRDQYAGLHRLLAAAIAALQMARLDGGIEIALRRSGGSYICGEETALIASLEGRRALPRERPPFPTERGLHGAPTLVQNVETLYRARAAWGATPEPDRPLSRLLDPALRPISVSGRVRRPGLRIAGAATTIDQLVAASGGLAGGIAPGGVVIGGSAGTILPPALGGLTLEALAARGIPLGTGSLVVLGAGEAPRAAAAMAAFLARESCGQCTPCRVGTTLMAERLRQPKPDGDPDTLAALARVLREASLCGLGRAAGGFLARWQAGADDAS